MAHLRDPHSWLGAALVRLVPDVDVAIARSTSRPWASITFSGARHTYMLTLSGPQARQSAKRICDQLPQQDFDMAGHIVADIVAGALEEDVEEGAINLHIEALTVEEA